MLEKKFQGLDVSCETKAKLQTYIDILLKWNKRINLISKNSLYEIWERHILDSAQIIKFISKSNRVIDIGADGGFPGLVLSILGVEGVIMVEADVRKSCFLEEASRLLNLKAHIINDRIENIYIEGDVAVARGFSDINNILKLHTNIKTPRILLLKGKNVELEIAAARKNWIFSCKKHKSITNVDSFLLEISDVYKKD